MRILIIEDHEDSLDALRRLLEHAGHDVIAVGSLAEGQSLAQSETYDLLITSLSLHDGDGIGLAEIAKSKGAKAVALTGFGMPSDIRKTQAAGFDAHLVKPMRIEDIREFIATMV